MWGLIALLLALFASDVRAEAVLVQGTAPNGGGSHSYAFNANTTQEAIDKALSDCRQHSVNCTVMRQFRKQCFAMAYRAQGGWYFDFALNMREAQTKALEGCRRLAPNSSCRLVMDFCDSVSEAERRTQAEAAERERSWQEASERQRQSDEAKARIDAIVAENQRKAQAERDAARHREKRDQEEALQKERHKGKLLVYGFLIVLAGLCVAGAWPYLRQFNIANLSSFTTPSFTAPTFSSAKPTAKPAFTEPPAEPLVKDTPTARGAMELAHAYLSDVEKDVDRASEDLAVRKDCLRTLALASKQIAAAEQADPTATIVDDEGTAINLTYLKAHALYNEAHCHFDNPRKAISIFQQCVAFEPLAAQAHFWIGLLYTVMYKKQLAIDALQTAAAIEPGNIQYRKMLDRARNLSRGEILLDRSIAVGKGTISFMWGAYLGFLLLFVGVFIYGIYAEDWSAIIASVAVIWTIGAMIVGTRTAKAKVKGWFGDS